MNELIDELMKAAGATEASYPPMQIIARLFAALLVGWGLGLVYRWTYTGQRFLRTIPHTQVLLTVGGAMIWLVVGNNLVRAFGLAGTIALIRYRTIISDPKDTTILLFSMVLGMACGLGQFAVAAIGAVFISLTLAGLYLADRRAQKQITAEPADLRELLGLDKQSATRATQVPGGDKPGRPVGDSATPRTDRSTVGSEKA